ncbi:MAG TPA: acyl-CoA dehydrogenase family protein [Rhodanobacteraceae bacterium]|nr:acyl-CoA dehydrogenase family protein [Rhodanobacteraceae bacterium]
MSFIQSPPQLGNQYREDRVLRSYLRRTLPPAKLLVAEGAFDALGEHAAAAWRRRSLSARKEPVLTRWDAWGNRVDRIELTHAWREGPGMAARHGLIAVGHDANLGVNARVQQFALVYLYHVASEFYTCPLAMTDGVATALKAVDDRALNERALPHFLSRDPAKFWIAGQWMTENAGGSDVGNTETVARRDGQGGWRLSGRKWFTSAINADAALALARPLGNPTGADGLALFYLETRDERGDWNGIRIDRLKDKLGTRELPTAEIHLNDTPATLVGEPAHGVRAVVPVLQVTRLWNSIGALATMRRCIALVRDYAQRRVVFGRALIEQPLYADMLASMQAEFEAAFQLVFYVAELMGRVQARQASEEQQHLFRILTPMAKLWTGNLVVRIASETVEAFGGMGYLEDSGIPQLLRDAQVFPIWEGAGNVQALDALGALQKNGAAPLQNALRGLLTQAQGNEVAAAAQLAEQALAALETRLRSVGNEASARGVAITCARAFAAALLARHAEWSLRAQADPRPLSALHRVCAHGLIRLQNHSQTETRSLATDLYA